MKKLISMLLVLALVMTMSVSAMAISTPSPQTKTNTRNGYTYSCTASANISSASGSMTYGDSKATISAGVNLKLERRSDGTESSASDADNGRSSVSVYYSNTAYRITKASFGFAVGNYSVFTPIFD